MDRENRQITWINGSKLVAVLAVLVDHTNGVLYTDPDIAYASYFSVSLFILLSGMTSYISNSYSGNNFGGGYIRSCKKIVAAYCTATAVYMVVMTHGFDFYGYLYYLAHFNISGPHYFVLLYIQLMACSKFLYLLLQRCTPSLKGYFCEGMIMASILALSVWTTNHTNILGVYGGGGKLFGGTYLILFFCGMLTMRHGWLDDPSVGKSASALVISGACWFLFWRFVCKNGLVLEGYMPYGAGFNPPGITFAIFAFCMLPMTFGFFTLLERCRHLCWISQLAGWVGKHTLYIFLYHRLILDYCLQRYMPWLPAENIWLARAVFFLMMVAGSLAIEAGIVYVRRFLRWVF